MMSARVLHGDCLDIMPTLGGGSVDSIVCDPPYGLSFMGKAWDHGVPGVPFWDAARRVAKPGAYLLAFGGTRTSHRLACAIEDAGWRIQDTLSWLYGSGFPKHRSKLKPAWEPIIMAWKPDVSATPLNIDACRLATGESLAGGGTPPFAFGGTNARPFHANAEAVKTGNDGLGRWPANVCLDEEAARLLDEQSGALTSGGYPPAGGMRSRNATYGEPSERGAALFGASTGGASRFYYCAKTSRSERDAGLAGERKALTWSSGTQNPGTFQSEGTDKTARNHHPTVKPIALMRWLCRLVTPPGGRILDPFCGSGSTGCAAVLDGFSFDGIEREAEFVDIANARITYHAAQYTPTLDLGGAA